MSARVPKNVLADRLVACRACGAGFGEACKPREQHRNRRQRRADEARGPLEPGTFSCIARRMLRCLTFRGMGDDPVGWLLREAGPGGSRAEVLEVLRERSLVDEARRVARPAAATRRACSSSDPSRV